MQASPENFFMKRHVIINETDLVDKPVGSGAFGVVSDTQHLGRAHIVHLDLQAVDTAAQRHVFTDPRNS